MMDPYASPATTPVREDAELVRVRREHLAHERNVQALGFIFYLCGFAVAAGSVTLISPDERLLGFTLCMVGLLMVAAGFGLRRQAGWGRVLSLPFLVLGLVLFPVGTIGSPFALYVLFSKKGRFVFTRDYQKVVEESGDVQVETSKALLLVLSAVIIVAGAALAYWYSILD